MACELNYPRALTHFEVSLKFWSAWRPRFYRWNYKNSQGRSWGFHAGGLFMQLSVKYDSTGYRG